MSGGRTRPATPERPEARPPEAAAPLGVRPAGDRALLLEYAGLDEVLAHHQHLCAHPLDGQREAVAAARTILLRFDGPAAARRAREQVSTLRVAGFSAAEARVVELDVVYDGEDLDEVAAAVSMSREALIAWHAGQDWTGAFGGFAPGFTYCTPTDAAQALQVPRRETPRTALPAGSVALAAEFSAVYPRVSPGGWQLIGRTAAAMWDLDRGRDGESPALVRPGDVVRYRAVRELAVGRESGEGEAGRSRAEVRPQQAEDRGEQPEVALEVVSAGLQTLVQDFGREGFSDLGVSCAGAADEPAMRQANRLVGSAAEAPVLETLGGGLSLRARRTVVLAVAGAEVELRVDEVHGGSRSPAPRAPFALTVGETVTLAAPRRGLRSVVAIRGGLAVAPVLGSASADTLSGLGPEPLQAGDRLAVGDRVAGPVGAPEPGTLPAEDDDGAITLRMIPGPRADWFAAEELERLQRQRWQVSPQADRIGVRLQLADDADAASPDAGAETDVAPRPLRRSRSGELPSEGVPRGALQVPPSGLPVLFLNDHPVTGGYPVIGVILAEDLPAAAQLAPGRTLRLRAVDPDAPSPADC